MKSGEELMKKKKNISIVCSILLFLSFTTASFSTDKDILAQVNILEKIIISKKPNTLEVKILLNRYTTSEHFKMGEPDRIVIDFYETENISASRQIDVNDFGILSIRAGMYKSDTARVVFDLGKTIPFYRIESVQDGVRVLFWEEEVAEVKKEEVISEKIQVKEAVGYLKVEPAKANQDNLIFIDMSESRNAESMEVDVFNAEGDKTNTIRLTPEACTSQIRLNTPGVYVFKGRAYNSEGKPSENLCETSVQINYPPICKLDYLYYEEYTGEPFILDASASTDPDGEVVKAHFKVTDESLNLIDSFTASKKPFLWNKTFEREGLYSIPVVVADDSGAVSEPVQVQVAVNRKRVFLMIDGGTLFARGSPYGGYAVSRLGLVIKIAPRTLDFILSGGAGQVLISNPWKSFFTANMLLNAHVGPAFLGVGAGITTKIREDRNPDGELIANVGFELTGKHQIRRSFFFEVRGPVGKGRIFSEHHKLMVGFRFLL
jgi:hypothetical protein